jgi:hypothetical protein
MENEIKKFDVNEAMKNVKDKIKDAFVTLIPDEQWNEMVKKEIDSYFKQTEARYDNRQYVSDFTRDVHSVLQQEVKNRVKTYLNDNFNATWYDNGVPVCNAKVEEMITKNAGKILSDMIGGTIQMALQGAGYRL